MVVLDIRLPSFLSFLETSLKWKVSFVRFYKMFPQRAKPKNLQSSTLNLVQLCIGTTYYNVKRLGGGDMILLEFQTNSEEINREVGFILVSYKVIRKGVTANPTPKPNISFFIFQYN